MKSVAEVVEHVVAPAVDDSGLQDGVGETRPPHDLLGGELRLVVARAAGRPRPEKAEQRDVPNPGATGRLHDVARPLHMHCLIGLAADLAIDPGAVRDRRAAREGACQFADIIQPDRGQSRARKPAEIRAAVILPAGEKHHGNPGRRERAGEMTADKAGAAGDGYFWGRDGSGFQRIHGCRLRRGALNGKVFVTTPPVDDQRPHDLCESLPGTSGRAFAAFSKKSRGQAAGPPPEN